MPKLRVLMETVPPCGMASRELTAKFTITLSSCAVLARTGGRGVEVVLDSVGTVFHQFADSAIVRRELFRVAAALKHSSVDLPVGRPRLVTQCY